MRCGIFNDAVDVLIRLSLLSFVAVTNGLTTKGVSLVGFAGDVDFLVGELLQVQQPLLHSG